MNVYVWWYLELCGHSVLSAISRIMHWLCEGMIDTRQVCDNYKTTLVDTRLVFELCLRYVFVSVCVGCLFGGLRKSSKAALLVSCSARARNLRSKPPVISQIRLDQANSGDHIKLNIVHSHTYIDSIIFNNSFQNIHFQIHSHMHIHWFIHLFETMHAIKPIHAFKPLIHSNPVNFMSTNSLVQVRSLIQIRPLFQIQSLNPIHSLIQSHPIHSLIHIHSLVARLISCPSNACSNCHIQAHTKAGANTWVHLDTDGIIRRCTGWVYTLWFKCSLYRTRLLKVLII